jgi:hypothetical protein
MKFKILNLVIFQLGWAVCIFGGNLMAVAYSLIALLIHNRYLVKTKSEWQLIGLVILVGITWDSLVVFFGLIFYPDAVWLGLPVWLVCIWALFATTFMHSLLWLSRYYYFSVMLAAVFGPMTYWSGTELSDAYFGASPIISMLVIGAGWAALFPLGLHMAVRIKQ